MHQQVPLQPSLQAGGQPGCRGVSQQSQLVENPSAKVVRNHGEAVIRALELEGTKNQSYSPHLLTEKGTNPLALQDPVALMVVCARACVCACVYTNGGQKRALDTMELDQAIVSLLIRVMGN